MVEVWEDAAGKGGGSEPPLQTVVDVPSGVTPEQPTGSVEPGPRQCAEGTFHAPTPRGPSCTYTALLHSNESVTPFMARLENPVVSPRPLPRRGDAVRLTLAGSFPGFRESWKVTQSAVALQPCIDPLNLFLDLAVSS